MGYRHYFNLVDTQDCKAVENFTCAEWEECCKKHFPDAVDIDEYDDGTVEIYINFHRVLNQKEIHEFGKLYYEDTAERIESKGKPLFNNAETKEMYEYYNPYVVGKEGLLEAIEIYRQKVVDYYTDMLKDGAIQILPFGIEINREDIKSIDKVQEHIKDMIFWWRKGAIDTDLDDEQITGSWLYEHRIFELVRLYKTIDWNTKSLLFYGY